MGEKEIKENFIVQGKIKQKNLPESLLNVFIVNKM